MKCRTALLLALAMILSATVSIAAVPPVMNYQGKLMQPSGVQVPDGTYSMNFAIYGVPTGGTALWSETNGSVQVKGGLFSVLLGSVNNLPANIFDALDRWFGVTVGTDPEMSPRQRIGSVPYADRAGVADSAVTVANGAITTDKVAPGAITADRLAPGVAIPPGTILMWSGAATGIPQGWALCDGTNGTPNLRDRFIVGAGNEYAVGTTGGEKFHQLTVAEMPSHAHRLAANWDLPGTNPHVVMPAEKAFGGMQTEATGGDQPHENRPPYYALCFIMKLAY